MFERIAKVGLFIALGAAFYAAPASAASLAERLGGYILLQVEQHGEAWYVDPVSLSRSYMKDGAAAYEALREFGLGISNADLKNIPVGVEVRFADIDSDGDGLADKLEEGLKTDPASADSDNDGTPDGQEILTNNTDPLGSGRLVYDQSLVARLKGRILLQVQSRGEAWYLNPKDGKRYYMKDGDAAYQIMRFLSLGITDNDLSSVPIYGSSGSAPAGEGDGSESGETGEGGMVRGTADPDFVLETYDVARAMAGTTLLPDNHVSNSPRIIEVNMLGEIVWSYDIPQELKKYSNPGFDVELLSNNNVLFVLPGNGVYEVNRNKEVVWSYKTTKISHDADRLANGNTIFVYGNNDTIGDAQVTEVAPAGNVVWSWYARDHYNMAPYNTLQDQGWTHTNAVSRLANGHTLVSTRNFNMVVEVDALGEVVKTIGGGVMTEQHDPALLENGNMLAANHSTPESAVEIDPAGNIVWQYDVADSSQYPLRDANRLPNGNTLITTTKKIIEVTPNKEIVWALAIKDTSAFIGQAAAGLGFYKAERLVE